ncbi:hypothetical protein SLS53_005514 [Cytospora paraplurivora]|uniref:Uncharacterized protein n=1 Tax=Cytospora paraplurivora TaxID=2898453 RepID=A0AAN9UDK5_9PEZI
MPRFAFGKRKSTAGIENDLATPSFRVLDRSEVVTEDPHGRTFAGGANLSAKTHTLPRTTVSSISLEDNIFAEYKPTYRNASTTPSSAELNVQEDWRLANKKRESQIQHTSKSSSSSFLKSAGRTWSFGGNKKQLPSVPAGNEDIPVTPPIPVQYKGGRTRATTTSTDATVTPPQMDQDIGLDLGGSFGKMFSGSGFDKRSSVMTLKDESGRQIIQPVAPTAVRSKAPSPIQVDTSSRVEPPQHSWASHGSNDNLLAGSPQFASPNRGDAPPVPRHGDSRPLDSGQTNSDKILKRTSAMFGGRRKSMNKALDEPEGDDLNSSLMAVSRYMSDGHSRSPTPAEAVGGPYRRNGETSGPGYKVVSPQASAAKGDDSADEDDNLFDTVPLNTERFNVPRQPQHDPPEPPPVHKVMTTSEFEKYRKDKEVENKRAELQRAREQTPGDEEDDEINYDDEDDEIEKSKQVAKQRRKQEAHMSVYRQQMMKVIGDPSDAAPSRPGMQSSFSTPNLSVPTSSMNPSDASEDDEEVPLAILAAHGFPNRNRPPARLSTMMSNPNLRQASQPSYQRPGSAVGQNGGGNLPPFARGLPQDPYGLVNAPPRESFALGGGIPAGHHSPVPPGGLVGVIANEEKARALRRGSPQVAQMDGYQGQGPFDPIQGIPQHMMYPPPQPVLSPGEQAQIQLNQQMSQFMQMQMQFMQMMATNNNNNSNNNVGNGPPRSAGHAGSNSVNSVPGINHLGVPDPNQAMHGSFLGPPTFGGDMHGRTMSMVQPSSASWLQPPQPGYAGSIHHQPQGNGYASSIAPSERSNVGLPGRYRPVSHIPSAPETTPGHIRQSSTMSGALSPYSESQTITAGSRSPGKRSTASSTRVDDDDDDEEGWAAMKAKREQRKSTWRMRKTLAPGELDISSLIT